LKSCCFEAIKLEEMNIALFAREDVGCIKYAEDSIVLIRSSFT